ncbi:MAG: hypothetical protein ACLPKB_24765 [Xanthobacteraceae bacterium]
MKTVFCRIEGAPEPGDEIRLCYTTPRGGRTDAWHIARDGDGVVQIASGLADIIGKTWMSDCFQAKAKAGAVVITCASVVDDVILYPDIYGKGTVTVVIEE